MIVALSAKKRCGKDTVAKMIIEMSSGSASMYKLAWPIKRALHAGLISAHAMGIIDSVPTFDELDGEAEMDREEKLYSKHTAEVIFNESIFFVCQTLGSQWAADYRVKMQNRVREHLSSFNDDFIWSVRELMQQIGTDIGCYVDEMIWMRYMAIEYLEAMAQDRVLVVTDCRQDHEMFIMRRMGAIVCHIIHPIYTHQSTDSHSTEKGLTVYDTDYVINNDSSLIELRSKVEQLYTIIDRK